MNEKEREKDRYKKRERERERDQVERKKVSKRISNMSKLLDIYHNVVKYFRAK